MTPRPATFRRNLCLVAGLAVAVRVGIAVASWRATTKLAEDGAQISKAQEALGALESVRAGLDKARSAELTYMLTGSGEDLADYDEAERSTRRQLAHAWTLCAEEPALQARFTALAKAVDVRFELKGAAEAARSNGLSSPKAKVVARVSASATARAGAAVDEARAAVQAGLQLRQEALRHSVSRSLTRIGATALLSIGLIIGLLLWLLPAFDERVAERDSLRPQPAGTAP